MKFIQLEATSIEQLMIAHHGNITKASKSIGITRTTLRKYINNDENVILVKEGDELKPFVADRRSGKYKRD